MGSHILIDNLVIIGVCGIAAIPILWVAERTVDYFRSLTNRRHPNE